MKELIYSYYRLRDVVAEEEKALYIRRKDRVINGVVMFKFYAMVVLMVLSACRMRVEDSRVAETPNMPSAESHDQRVTAMTYNIAGYMKPDLDVIAQEIKDEKPDFVGLQEVDRFTKRNNFDMAVALGKKTGMTPLFKKAIPENGGDFGVAILSRHPIKQDGAILLPHPKNIATCTHKTKEQRVVLWAETDHPSVGRIYFATTHFGLCSYERDAAAEKIQKDLAGKKPLLFVGDINERWLRDQKSTSLAEAFSKAGFVEAGLGKESPERIDWILADSCWTPRSLKVLPKSVSDHSAVVATLSFQCL